MWSLRVVTPPAAEPLTLVDVKAQCRIDYTDEDTLLSGYITAARETIERETSRALLTQTFELGLDDFPERSDRIRIPRGQLQSIVSVTYVDTALTSYTMTQGTDFLVNQYAEPAEVVLPFNHVWPQLVLSSSAPVVIQFTAGWADAASVPQGIKQAMLMLIADWYENREDVYVGRSAAAVSVPNGVDRLLANYRLRYYTPFQR